MAKSLLILGSGGHGGVIADTAEALGYGSIMFHDDRWPDVQSNLVWPVIGKIASAELPGHDVFVAIGNNFQRLQLVESLLLQGRNLPSLIHPSAHVSRHAVIGLGSFVGPCASVNVGTNVGLGVIINTSASVDHDCRIGNGVHISPGAHLAGKVTVGRESWIGIGANIRENTIIGERSLVGAGATVVSDVGDDIRVLGIPARKVD